MYAQLFIASNNNVVHLAKTRAVRHACRATNDKSSNPKDLTAISGSSKQLHEYCFDSIDKLSRAHGIKIEDLRPVIRSVEDPLESLMLIDATHRLGIDYHFRDEIERILQRQHMKTNLRNNHESKSLVMVSLCFRLLRQEAHSVPAEVFNGFKDKKGRFDEELRRDVRGLMELYEAAQLNLEAEDILDEAANFSRKHLNESLKHLDENQAKKVRNTLKHPYHKSLSKFMAKSFLKDFTGVSGWIKPLQELARMEFKMAQSIHRQELSQVLKWWKDLDLIKDLELARDQPVKWYTWTMACIGDINLSELRIELTKSLSFIYIIDDIFDIYGTMTQLTLFTEAVNRWDFSEVDELPNYMKKCLKALYDVTNAIGHKIYKKYGHNPINFLRQTWASLCNAFLEESKWFASGDLPKAEKYLNIARVTSGADVIMVHMFFLFGFGATKESVMCLNDIADMTSSVATILRLCDDLGSAKDENQDGNDGTYVKCFVQEHGVAIQFAREHALHIISDEWKRLNKESLHLHKLSASFTKALLNSARMVPSMYNVYDDDQSLALQAYVKSVLYDDAL